MRTTGSFAILGIVLVTVAARAESVQLYAAGSLRAGLTDVVTAFETESGIKVDTRFGPSGLLKDEIIGGAKVDVFASANTSHPQALSAAKKSGPVLLFARNRLCALVKPAHAISIRMISELTSAHG
jgi:molybdate transport system substrate-binding protein